MNAFLENAGLIAFSLLVLYILKLIFNWRDNKTYVSEDKVFKAAKAFEQEKSFDEIRDILKNCIDLNEEDIEEILTLAFPHRSDEDGGYSAFLEAVNSVLGEDVYQVRS